MEEIKKYSREDLYRAALLVANQKASQRWIEYDSRGAWIRYKSSPWSTFLGSFSKIDERRYQGAEFGDSAATAKSR